MHSVTLETHYPECAPSISANQPRLAAGLLALIMNALEAIEGLEHPVMRVTIETSPENMYFRVWNSGPIILAEDMARNLTPYVSTREGCHIGLGLDLARNAALFHGGALTYDPESGFCLAISKFGAQIANTES
jgi:C4-dicarboxylate-specific signal transduction histidine kinase